eukprot:TRINITY_DN3535_c0_g1_i1.p1 TRINITY_DN3535_c0_g1~~TRINITY_DN3535_c0_g1_i1.p1  ORF type:complete len:394 (-),score=43.01 TRINITY_DN3535_c0_g1_i1:377-1390(-)
MAPSRQVLAQLDKQILTLAKSSNGNTSELGAFISQVSNLINGTMKTNVRNRHANEQSALNTSYQEYAKCNFTSVDETALQTAADNHATCRNQQLSDWTNYSNCTNTTGAAANQQAAACNASDNLRVFPDVQLCNNEFTQNPWSDNKHENLKAEADRFRNLLAALQNASDNCTNNTFNCTAEELAYNTTRDSCDQKQELLETTACTYSDTCYPYHMCFTNANTTYHTKKQLVEAAEEELKAEWHSLLRIECLLSALTSANKKTEIDTCKTKTYDLSEMNITYYVPPTRQNCTHPNYLIPGTSDFALAWFTNISESAQQYVARCASACTCCGTNPDYNY